MLITSNLHKLWHLGSIKYRKSRSTLDRLIEVINHSIDMGFAKFVAIFSYRVKGLLIA